MATRTKRTHKLARLQVSQVSDSRAKYGEPITSMASVHLFVIEEIGNLDREAFVAIHLNAKHEPVNWELVSLGSLSASLVHPREVFKAAIVNNAAAIIVAHNHPSGRLEFSPDDVAITRRLVCSGSLLGLQVLDHVLVSERAAVSMLETNPEIFALKWTDGQ